MFGYKKKYEKAPWFKAAGLKEPVKKPKPIARRSREGRSRESKYNKRVAEWKKEHPICMFPGCSCKTKDCHHSFGKLKKLLMDESRWIALCRCHHNFVGNNIEASRGIFVRTGDGRRIPLIAPLGRWNIQKENG